MMWPTKSSAALNSLQYKCMQQVTNACKSTAEARPANWFDELLPSAECLLQQLQDHEQEMGSKLLQSASMPAELRQQLHDHVVRERVPITCDFLCGLLQGGGLRNLDLWTLADSSDFSRSEMKRILDCVCENGHSLTDLSLGGGHWLFDTALTTGPLRRVFKQAPLNRLHRLRLQQAHSVPELAVLLCRCPQLQALEIVQPSLTDSQLQWLASRASGNSIVELRLPSTVHGLGLAAALDWLPNLRTLHCAQFEDLVDVLDQLTLEWRHGSVCSEDAYEKEEEEDTDRPSRSTILRSLAQIHTLHITQPLSADVPARLARLCPSLRRLRLETQELMRLDSLASLRRLQALHLHNSPTLGASYLNQVLPLLREIGSQLLELSLEQFDVVDLREIGKLCPRLCALSVQWFSILGIGRITPNYFAGHLADQQWVDEDQTTQLPERLKHLRHFAKLRCLRLRPRVHRPLAAHLLEFVLCNSPSLIYLECYGVEKGSEQQWNRMISCPCNGWSRLKYLIVRHGHELSAKSISQILRVASDLMHLECEKPPLSKTDLVPNPSPLEPEFF